MIEIKKLIYKLTINNKYMDSFIRMVEYIRGLYRYPNKMLGRRTAHLTDEKQTDILVFAAHPDDEVLGVGTSLYRHRQNKEKVAVAYITNGAGGDGASWKFSKKFSQNISDIRYEEGVRGLSHIGIDKDDVFCLGYPDAGTHRYLKSIAKDVLKFIQTMKPKKIYVHCVEAGHSDHDITSFVVKYVCKKIGYTNVFEWAEYHRKQSIGSPNITFKGSRTTPLTETILNITEKEEKIKKTMLACHQSQHVTGHFKMGEAIRQAYLIDLEQEILHHSAFSGERFQSLINKFVFYINQSPLFNSENYQSSQNFHNHKGLESMKQKQI